MDFNLIFCSGVANEYDSPSSVMVVLTPLVSGAILILWGEALLLTNTFCLPWGRLSFPPSTVIRLGYATFSGLRHVSGGGLALLVKSLRACVAYVVCSSFHGIGHVIDEDPFLGFVPGVKTLETQLRPTHDGQVV